MRLSQSPLYFKAMNVPPKAAVLLAAGLVCASCGGSAVSNDNSPYTGNYVGEFVDTNSKVGGFSVAVVEKDGIGNISGQYTASKQTVNFTGSIASSGVGTITTANGQSGKISFGSTNSQLTSLSVDIPDLAGAIAVLVKNPNANIEGHIAFTAYAGSITGATQNGAGALAMLVNSNGAVSGIETVVVNGNLTATPIAGTAVDIIPSSPSADGVAPGVTPINVAITYKSALNGVTANGTISILNADVSGTVSLSNGGTAALALTSVQQVDYPGLARR